MASGRASTSDFALLVCFLPRGQIDLFFAGVSLDFSPQIWNGGALQAAEKGVAAALCRHSRIAMIEGMAA
jgi:hypothetical protein